MWLYSINNFKLQDTESSLHGGDLLDYSIYYKNTYVGDATYDSSGALVNYSVYAGSEIYFYYALRGLTVYFKDSFVTVTDFLELLYQYKTVSDFYVDSVQDNTSTVLVLMRDLREGSSIGSLTVVECSDLETAEDYILSLPDLDADVSSGNLRVYVVSSIKDLYLHVNVESDLVV